MLLDCRSAVSCAWRLGHSLASLWFQSSVLQQLQRPGIWLVDRTQQLSSSGFASPCGRGFQQQEQDGSEREEEETPGCRLR